MSTLLPIDDNGNPISILGFDYRGTRKLAVGAASTRNAAPIADDIEVVSIIATGFCRFEIGDASVTADLAASPFLYPGQYRRHPAAARRAAHRLHRRRCRLRRLHRRAHLRWRDPWA